jgi:hypothetical protein
MRALVGFLAGAAAAVTFREPMLALLALLAEGTLPPAFRLAPGVLGLPAIFGTTLLHGLWGGLAAMLTGALGGRVGAMEAGILVGIGKIFFGLFVLPLVLGGGLPPFAAILMVVVPALWAPLLIEVAWGIGFGLWLTLLRRAAARAAAY